MYGQSISQKTVRNITTKDTSGTLPIYLYAADSPTVQPLDFTVLSEAAAVPVPHREITETLYKVSQIVCVKADSNELSSVVHNTACRQENVSVGMKTMKAKVIIQDPLNPVLLRCVDVSNIVCALTWYKYREDILELEEGDLILLLDVLHDTNEVVTVAEAAETVEMTETATRGGGGGGAPWNYRFESDFFLLR